MRFVRQIIPSIFLIFQSASYANHTNLKGDPAELLPSVDGKHMFPYRITVPRSLQQQTGIISSNTFTKLKGDLADLQTEESRNKKSRYSYNRQYKPKRSNYNHQDRHSGGKNTDGGYHKTDSYKGNTGYSTYSSYDKAKRDHHGDSDHKKYKNDGQRKQHGEHGADNSNNGGSYHDHSY